MKFIKKNIIGVSIVSILVIALIVINLYRSQQLNQETSISVAKVTELTTSKFVSRQFTYVYYFEGNLFTKKETFRSSYPKDILNEYFVVKFSKQNPKNSEIYLHEPVFDSIKIKEAGFK